MVSSQFAKFNLKYFAPLADVSLPLYVVTDCHLQDSDSDTKFWNFGLVINMK